MNRNFFDDEEAAKKDFNWLAAYYPSREYMLIAEQGLTLAEELNDEIPF